MFYMCCFSLFLEEKKYVTCTDEFSCRSCVQLYSCCVVLLVRPLVLRQSDAIVQLCLVSIVAVQDERSLQVDLFVLVPILP